MRLKIDVAAEVEVAVAVVAAAVVVMVASNVARKAISLVVILFII